MLKERLEALVFGLAEKTFYKATKNIDVDSLKKKLALVDYPYSTGHYFAYWLALAAITAILGFVVAIAVFVSGTFASPIVFLAPFIAGAGVAAFSFVWPSMELSKKNKIIAANLPLAILTMSTISEGGAPPQYMFQSIAGNPDYPWLEKECMKIQRFMDQLGLSFSKAVAKEIELTPSVKLQTFLKELNTTLRSGGDLKEFMSKRADDAYFEYMLQLERSAERAETLGEIYSIILIAAPLFLFFAVMLLGMFATESGIFGLSAEQLVTYGVWLVIPLANILFIAVMMIMSPE
ncbi:MAG: type II secretion system F family protein [Candidatus Diapherotrites archaeon]